MAIRFVRQPNETPNISNVDDIVGLRYAYGGQNGYVIGKGAEIGYSVSGSTLKITSGRVVLQGVESDIDANGILITVDNIATKRFYSVYYEVNLALQTVKISAIYDTAGYPDIDTGDDLTTNNSGIARMELYRFVATNGVISDVSKIAGAINYTQEQIDDLKRGLNDGSIVVKHASISENTKKINDIAITQDSNGVLKVGNAIIPQKVNILKKPITLVERATLSSNEYLLEDIKPNQRYEIIAERKDPSEVDKLVQDMCLTITSGSAKNYQILKAMTVIGLIRTHNTEQVGFRIFYITLDQNTSTDDLVISHMYEESLPDGEKITYPGGTIMAVYKIIE